MTQKHVVLTAAMIGFPVLLLVYQITKTRSDLKSCQSKSAYIEALVRHASPDHYIVLALVDAAFVDMAINLYEMSFRPNAVDNFLFVGVGQRVCEIMNASSAGLPCYLYRCTPTMWRPTSPAARLHEHGLHPEDEHPHGHDRRSTERRLYCPTHRLGHRLLPQSTSASPHMHDKYLIYFELHVSLIWFAQQKVQKVLRLQLHDTKVHDMQFRKKKQNTFICRFCDLGVHVCSTKISVFADDCLVIELIQFTAVWRLHLLPLSWKNLYTLIVLLWWDCFLSFSQVNCVWMTRPDLSAGLLLRQACLSFVASVRSLFPPPKVSLSTSLDTSFVLSWPTLTGHGGTFMSWFPARSSAVPMWTLLIYVYFVVVLLS